MTRLTTEQIAIINAVPGHFHVGDMEALHTLITRIPSTGTIVEVGGLHGRSTVCAAISAPNATIYCYDLWAALITKIETDGKPVVRLNTLKTFKSYTEQFTNIIPKKLDKHLAFDWDIDNPIDMLFIDAGHRNPYDLEIIQYWIARIKTGGIISGHDYYPNHMFPNVNDNVKKLEKIFKQPAEVFEASGVWSFSDVNPYLFR